MVIITYPNRQDETPAPEDKDRPGKDLLYREKVCTVLY
jgi:hypothetical protein